MDPLAAAARAAAAPSLDAVPVPLFGQVTPEALSAAKASLLTGLSDALVAGIGLPSILAAATAAHAGFAAAREEARARAALTADASHNDGTAGDACGDEEYEGPRLIPLHTSVLTYLVNKLRSDV